MRPTDPFGLAVLDHHRGRRRDTPLIERDDGVLWEEPIHPYFEGEEGWIEEERDALSSLRGRVLDLGCGPGRHLLALQQRTFTVGLDICTTALAVCRERGGRNLVLASAVRLPFRAESFDHVLLMSNGLGMTGGLEETAEMLREVRGVLSRRGELIAHTTNPENPKSGVGADYSSKNREMGNPPGLLRVRMRYGEVVGPWFELLLLTPQEVRSILERAGLALRRSVLMGPPYSASALYFATPHSIYPLGA